MRHLHLAIYALALLGPAVGVLYLLLHVEAQPPSQLVHQFLGVGWRGEGIELELSDLGVSGGLESVLQQVFAPDQEKGQGLGPFDDGVDILRDYLGRAVHVDLAGIQKDDRIVRILPDALILLVISFLHRSVVTLKQRQKNRSISLGYLLLSKLTLKVIPYLLTACVSQKGGFRISNLFIAMNFSQLRDSTSLWRRARRYDSSSLLRIQKLMAACYFCCTASSAFFASSQKLFFSSTVRKSGGFVFFSLLQLQLEQSRSVAFCLMSHRLNSFCLLMKQKQMKGFSCSANSVHGGGIGMARIIFFETIRSLSRSRSRSLRYRSRMRVYYSRYFCFWYSRS